MAEINSTSNSISDVSFNRIPAEVKERWRVVRDVVSGDQALRAGNYLPQLNKQDVTPANVARNEAYRQRAVWYPATTFTLEGLLGLAFRVDPITKLPANLDYLLEDCDGVGVSLYQQSQLALANNLAVGRHGLFVDWAEELGHPVIKQYHAENIINWRFSVIGGKSTLSMVVLEETVEIEDGQWGLKYIQQWREVFLDPDTGICMVRVWQENPAVAKVKGQPVQKVQVPIRVDKDEAGNDLPVMQIELRSRAKPLDYIPFAFIGSQNNDGNIDPSPLYGLSQVNLAHFRNSADYEDSVFFVGQVQPYITGLTEQWRNWLQNPKDAQGNPTGQVLYVGSRAPMLLPAGATFGYAQAEPNSLAYEAMEHKEKQMIAIGARMIEANKAGSRTATEDDNDKEATTSVLSMCISNVNEAYQKAIGFCIRFMDGSTGDTHKDTQDMFKIQQDFSRLVANPQIVAAMVQAWQTGLVAKQDVRDYLRKLGMVATERSNADIETSIETEGPSPMMKNLELAAKNPPVPGAAPKPPERKTS